MEEYYTVAELAELFKVSKDTVYKLCENREIPFIKIKGAIRFRHSTIEKWVTQQEKLNSRL